MKNIILTIIVLFFVFSSFSQTSMPMKIVNNTSENMQFYLVAKGNSTAFNCDCSNTFDTSDLFQVNSNDQITLQSFIDLPEWNRGPFPNICDPCNGQQAAALCGDPIFVWMRFVYPGIANGLGEECGNFYSNYFSQGSFTGSWQVINNTIIVTFND